MILSDGTIRNLMAEGAIVVDPEPDDSCIQPISIDLRLGTSFCHPGRHEDGTDRHWYAGSTVLPVGAFMLATTIERVTLSDSVAGTVVGKSTMARKGLLVEAAGLVDPGFDGKLTLELYNMSNLPIPLTAGMRIAQIKFEAVDYAVRRPYGSDGLRSHYQGQTRAEPAREG